jgi:hypothetical protein
MTESTERTASYYAATAHEKTDYPTLNGKVTVDVAVVGAVFSS